jgi:hypothetical protein
MRFAVFAVLAAAAIQDPPPAKEKPTPLRPLAKIAEHLDKGIAAFLKGTEPAKAFKPWTHDYANEDRMGALREAVGKHGVTSAAAAGFEINIQFMKKGEFAYGLRVLAWRSGSDFRLGGLEQRLSPARGVALAACKSQTVPVALAADGLIKLLKSAKPEDLPFADPEKTAPLLPEFARTEFADTIARSKARAVALLTQVAELEYDEVRIQMDDYSLIVRGEDGSLKQGFIRGKLSITPEGKFSHRLSRFETK